MSCHRKAFGFVLWEYLLVGWLSIVLMLCVTVYWRYWMRSVRVLLARAHTLQVAQSLPLVLSARWCLPSKQACRPTRFPLWSYISAKAYHQQYRKRLMPVSEVLQERVCEGSHWHKKAYFLALNSGEQEALYEKVDEAPAERLVSGVKAFYCRLDHSVVGDVSCQYRLDWPLLNGLIRSRLLVLRIHQERCDEGV